MLDQEPTARSRMVGASLLRATQNKGWTGSYLGELLGWSPSKVSRVFSGKRAGSLLDVSAALAVCGVRGSERDLVLGIADDSRNPNLLIDDEEFPLARLTLLTNLESGAAGIVSATSFTMPDLLQTEAYARAIASRSPISRRVDAQVERILERQQILDHHSPHRQFEFFLAESVFASPGLDQDVVSDQVHHLLRMSVRDGMGIRIVSSNAGAESFSLVEFSDGATPIVCIESLTSTSFLGRPSAARAYWDLASELRTRALDIADSRARLREMATSLEEARANGLPFGLDSEETVATAI